MLIDEEDFKIISKNKWYLKKVKSKIYASNNKGKDAHTLILGKKKGFEIDHINGDGLDNRKINLRFVTHSQNMMNSVKRNGTTSKFKGVSWSKYHKKWKADIYNAGKTKFLGYFDSEEEASKCYDKEAEKYYGKYSNLNKDLKEKK
jgi:hypothetical protein